MVTFYYQIPIIIQPFYMQSSSYSLSLSLWLTTVPHDVHSYIDSMNSFYCIELFYSSSGIRHIFRIEMEREFFCLPHLVSFHRVLQSTFEYLCVFFKSISLGLLGCARVDKRTLSWLPGVKNQADKWDHQHLWGWELLSICLMQLVYLSVPLYQ